MYSGLSLQTVYNVLCPKNMPSGILNIDRYGHFLSKKIPDQLWVSAMFIAAASFPPQACIGHLLFYYYSTGVHRHRGHSEIKRPCPSLKSPHNHSVSNTVTKCWRKKHHHWDFQKSSWGNNSWVWNTGQQFSKQSPRTPFIHSQNIIYFFPLRMQ